MNFALILNLLGLESIDEEDEMILVIITSYFLNYNCSNSCVYLDKSRRLLVDINNKVGDSDEETFDGIHLFYNSHACITYD